MSCYDPLRHFKIQEIKFYCLDDLHISILSESKNNKCPICRECYSYGEKIAESTCCSLRTHVACLSMWANQMERESPVTSPMPPMYGENQFSCLGCHRSMHRDTFNQAVDTFFRLYRPIPVVLRQPGAAYRHESRVVPTYRVSLDRGSEDIDTFNSTRARAGLSGATQQPSLRIANGSAQWLPAEPHADSRSGYTFEAWEAIARVRSGIGSPSARPRQSYSTSPAVDGLCSPRELLHESGETAKYTTEHRTDQQPRRRTQGASRDQRRPDLPQPTRLAAPVTVQDQSVGSHLVPPKYNTQMQMRPPNFARLPSLYNPAATQTLPNSWPWGSRKPWKAHGEA
jgi:hypothetical protein